MGVLRPEAVVGIPQSGEEILLNDGCAATQLRRSLVVVGSCLYDPIIVVIDSYLANNYTKFLFLLLLLEALSSCSHEDLVGIQR